MLPVGVSAAIPPDHDDGKHDAHGADGGEGD
jgi:hypothetical protein